MLHVWVGLFQDKLQSERETVCDKMLNETAATLDNLTRVRLKSQYRKKTPHSVAHFRSMLLCCEVYLLTLIN